MTKGNGAVIVEGGAYPKPLLPIGKGGGGQFYPQLAPRTFGEPCCYLIIVWEKKKDGGRYRPIPVCRTRREDETGITGQDKKTSWKDNRNL